MCNVYNVCNVRNVCNVCNVCTVHNSCSSISRPTFRDVQNGSGEADLKKKKVFEGCWCYAQNYFPHPASFSNRANSAHGHDLHL